MPSTQRSFYLLNEHARSMCAIFLHNWTQCIDSCNLLLQRYVTKGVHARNPAILRFLFVAERTQLNGEHVQNIAIKCRIAFSEIHLFLENQSLEFHEIWHENTLEISIGSIEKKLNFEVHITPEIFFGLKKDLV